MRCCRSTCWSLAALALVAGCNRGDDIQVYQAPRDPAAADARPASSEQEPSPGVPWTVPDGWRAKPASEGGARIASYEVTTPDGRSMDVSVIPLPGNSGSRLDNVNRWRGQVGLQPLTESDLAAQQRKVPIGTLEGDFFEMAGDTPVLQGKYKARTLAATMASGGTTVFFKATGEDALVAENRPKFLAWLASVQTGPAPAASAAASASSGEMRGPVAPPPPSAVPQWEVPAGWKPAPPTTMRLASFVIEGADGQQGDLSVVVLGSRGGGVLANVNRWRGQVGLEPLDDAGLAREGMQVASAAGDSALVVDLTGQGTSQGQRILGAIVERGDRAWFYKLTGPQALVGRQKDAFLGFLRSVKYP